MFFSTKKCPTAKPGIFLDLGENLPPMKKIVLSVLVLSAIFFFAFQKTDPDLASQFLASLNEEQRAKAQLPFDDLSREDWHFLPGAMWPRAGVQLHELDDNQKSLIFKLLQASLSEAGYDKTLKIIDLENVLAEMEGNTDFRDPEKYSIVFYGDPKGKLWAWSFEGHHISYQFTMADGKVSMTPRFMGANPAEIRTGERKGERTLAAEEDFGYSLVNSMSEEQRGKAIFQQNSFLEIVTSVSVEVSPLKPVGIKMSELGKEQQAILLDLIDEYLSAMPTELAEKRMENLQSEEFADIRFGWAGSTERGKAHYYRVQGKTFLIEFDNSQNNANHIHTVWRDFDGDFGRDIIREHYQHSHGGKGH